MAQHSVINTAPRAGSYFDDYLTVHDPTQATLNDSASAALYAELPFIACSKMDKRSTDGGQLWRRGWGRRVPIRVCVRAQMRD
ncbi:hypothetical protein GGX14DRAFT_574631 [Mycena pura]|uniref:Uncharacterized protein n=1 Tax=Mycena pura TaxID=153505 RepID=A0AAD6UWW6_9AGAR|nr:hypothetical protein GGX14DRAFT_574631 [Mycena pura]